MQATNKINTRNLTSLEVVKLDGRNRKLSSRQQEYLLNQIRICPMGYLLDLKDQKP